MAKKKSANPLKRKKDTSFGSVMVNHMNVPATAVPKAGLELTLSFEESLRLQLSLHQALWELNRLDRRLPTSRQKGVALTFYPNQNRLTVNMGTIQGSTSTGKARAKKGKGKRKEKDTELD
jgi:tmRNA-binding protein